MHTRSGDGRVVSEPSLDLYESIVERSPYGFAVVDFQGGIHFASRGIEAISGHPIDSLLGRNIVEFLDPDELETALAAFSEVGDEWGDRAGSGTPARLHLRHRDGHWVPIEAGGQITGDITLPGGGVVQGVVLRVRAAESEEALTRGLAVLAASGSLADVFAALATSLSFELPDTADVGLAFNWSGTQFDSYVPSGRHPATSPSLVETLHTLADRVGDRDELLTIDVVDLPHPTRSSLMDARVVSVWLHPVRVDSERACVVVPRHLAGDPWTTHRAVLERISAVIALALERDRADRLLAFAARHDFLTGLANRASFFDTLDGLVTRALDDPATDDRARGYAVLYVDLDDFKPVNDTWGHPTGDRLLQEVANRLRDACRPGDLIARIGGDEFAIVCAAVDSATAADAIGRRVLASIEAPFDAGDGSPSELGASIGVVFATYDSEQPSTERIVDLADGALYAVKRDGGRAVRTMTLTD